MKYLDIDFNELWQEARRQKSWSGKSRADWDRKAESFAKRTAHSEYADIFMDRMDPDPEWTVLDVGSGPGTLTLPLARRVKKVTAVDYSSQMLALLIKQAEADNLGNIEAKEASWEDDWQEIGIEPHDAVIASRSLAVDDLAGALTKMNQWAKKVVYVTDRVGATPFDPEAFAAVGREFSSGPDYIYTVNILYQLGINAKVDFIGLPGVRIVANREEALASYSWMFDRLTSDEEQKLATYVDSRLKKNTDGQYRLQLLTPPTWAFIHWDKPQEFA
jgi:SAM-dependent methyltransferase